MSTSPSRRGRRRTGRSEVAGRRGTTAHQVHHRQPVIAQVGSPTGPHRRACARFKMQAMVATTTGVPPVSWYGNTPWWRIALESHARRAFGDGLTVIERPGQLEYRVELDVRGPAEPVQARIMFHADPPYNTYGLHPSDYPRVFAEPHRESKHRMPDDALCLYFPRDPRWRRWTFDKGLLDLIDLAVDHLGYEDVWRATGGHNGGVWPGAEAEHGFAQEHAA